MGKAKAQDRAFTVDMWWTDLNDVEIGLFAHTRHRAKSREFTQDSDVIGEVLEGGERTGLITYREGLWKSENPGEKRLVLKLFTPSMNWRASMEMLVGRSVQLSTGAGGFPVTAYSIHIEGLDQIVQLERSARKWPGLPEQFSFFLMEDGEAKLYRLRHDWMDISGNYTLFDQTGSKIGHVTGHLFRSRGTLGCQTLWRKLALSRNHSAACQRNAEVQRRRPPPCGPADPGCDGRRHKTRPAKTGKRPLFEPEASALILRRSGPAAIAAPGAAACKKRSRCSRRMAMHPSVGVKHGRAI